MKRRIFGIGETVLDLIFKGLEPQAAKAGGSVLNALVSLARCGHEVYLVTDISNDRVGDMIMDFLTANGINTQYVTRYKHGQTPLAMAMLNADNDAEYEFYKNYPSTRELIAPADFTDNDLLLFGSFYSINPDIRKQVVDIVSMAKQMGSFVLYDPNFRKSHQTNIDLIASVKNNMKLANVVRASNEDVFNLFGSDNMSEICPMLQQFCANIVLTQNKDGATLFASTHTKHYPVRAIKPLSTIGAGDNFNAGLLHQFAKHPRSMLDNLTENDWDLAIASGVDFASHVCLSLDNYVSAEFACGLRS